MKLYIASINDKFEGWSAAIGIFTTIQKAENAASWFLQHKDFFSEYEHKVFVVDEIDVDDHTLFDKYKKNMEYMLYNFIEYSRETDEAKDQAKNIIKQLKQEEE
jgi:hypothetical protein